MRYRLIESWNVERGRYPTIPVPSLHCIIYESSNNSLYYLFLALINISILYPYRYKQLQNSKWRLLQCYRFQNRSYSHLTHKRWSIEDSSVCSFFSPTQLEKENKEYKRGYNCYNNLIIYHSVHHSTVWKSLFLFFSCPMKKCEKNINKKKDMQKLHLKESIFMAMEWLFIAGAGILHTSQLSHCRYHFWIGMKI